MDLLTLLIIVFLSPLLLILLVERSGQWFRTWVAYLHKNGSPYFFFVEQQRVTPVRRIIGQWLHQFADTLESWGLLRLFAALSHISIVFAVVVFIYQWSAWREEANLRRETLEVYKEEREARAWSLIYQSEKSTGDGGRRYALQYLNNEVKANLAGLPLAGAFLRGVKLRGAKLYDAKLSNTNLSEADLREAKLPRANLRGAILLLANLSKADLSNAILVDTLLNGADLRGANLSKANLRSEKYKHFHLGLLQEQIDSAFYCKQRGPPTLPAGFKPPPARKCDDGGNPIEE